MEGIFLEIFTIQIDTHNEIQPFTIMHISQNVNREIITLGINAINSLEKFQVAIWKQGTYSF